MKTQTRPKQNRNLVVRFKVSKGELAQIKGCSIIEKKTMSKYIRTNLNL